MLEVETEAPLPYVTFGDSDHARVGDWVIAIGNPFGLGGTTTSGIVSARGRDINNGPYVDYIQIDASINRGNSGGPLFNSIGEVIGVNTAIFSPNGGSVGIGFAIPASVAQGVIDQLRDDGRVARCDGWIGATTSVSTGHNDMAETDRTFFEYLVYVSENHSPLDFMLIADHIDKFFYGALLTIEIVIVMIQILLPFMILPIYSVMKTIPPSYMRAHYCPLFSQTAPVYPKF